MKETANYSKKTSYTLEESGLFLVTARVEVCSMFKAFLNVHTPGEGMPGTVHTAGEHTSLQSAEGTERWWGDAEGPLRPHVHCIAGNKRVSGLPPWTPSPAPKTTYGAHPGRRALTLAVDSRESLMELLSHQPVRWAPAPGGGHRCGRHGCKTQKVWAYRWRRIGGCPGGHLKGQAGVRRETSWEGSLSLRSHLCPHRSGPRACGRLPLLLSLSQEPRAVSP